MSGGSSDDSYYQSSYDTDSGMYETYDSDEDVPLFVLLARLVDSDAAVRDKALTTLCACVEPGTLAHHAHAVVPLLEDSNRNVRYKALATLRKLEPAAQIGDVGIGQ